MMASFPQPTLDDFIALHWSIIPCKLDKRPMIPSWKEFQVHPPTKEQITSWLEELHPPAWAIITGQGSGVIVLDFDGPQGMETLKRLGLKPHVLTPNGGAHVYLRHPGWRVATLNAKSKRKLGELWPGLDIRADGGYALFLGRNQAGAYRWLRAPVPDSLDLLPLDLRQFLGLAPPPRPREQEAATPARDLGGTTAARAEKLIQKALKLAPMEGRNNAGFLLATDLRDCGFSQTDAAAVMRSYVEHVPPTDQHGRAAPYTEREALESLRQAYTRAPRERPATSTERANSAASTQNSSPELSPIALPKECPRVPEEAWHPLARKYREAVAPWTEAPDNYHLACFLTVVGAMLGKSIYFLTPHALYPNFYTCLTGRSARVRKGTAMDFAHKLSFQTTPDLFWQHSIDSREGFIQALADRQAKQEEKDSIITIVRFSELRALVDKAAKEGLRNIVPTLADAYDCPQRLEVNTRKTPLAVNGPFTAFLAGASPVWIERLQIDDLEGGLGNRTVWVPGERKPPIPHMPEGEFHFPPEIVMALAKTRKHWQKRSPTRLQFSEESKGKWTAFYRALDTIPRGEALVEVLGDRMHHHCLKTAMVYAALDLSETIEAAHLDAAIAFADFLLHALAYIFTEFGLEELVKQERRILELVDAAGPTGITRRQLQRRLWRMDSETFSRRLRWMTGNEGLLRQESDGRSTVFFLNK